MMLINIDHECNAIYVERNFGKNVLKMVTREQKRFLSLMKYLVFTYNFASDEN